MQLSARHEAFHKSINQSNVHQERMNAFQFQHEFQYIIKIFTNQLIN